MRLWICDRCGEKTTTWSTRDVEVPDNSFIRKTIFELCPTCINGISKLMRSYIKKETV